jgi:hypothetical protein
MANIDFYGFVDPWQKDSPEHPDWGMKVTEVHQKKENDEWVPTGGRTFRTVKAAYGVEINFADFKQGDRVHIVGTEVTEVSERNGTKYYNLVVKAKSIEVMKAGEKPKSITPGTPIEIPNDWTEEPVF